MKILLIPEKDHFRDWIGKTYCDIINYYAKNSIYEVKIIWTDEYLHTNLKTIESISPNIIIFFDTDTLRFAHRFSYIYDMNIPIFACSLDLFYFKQCINCPYIKKSNGLIHFSKATKLLNSYKLQFPNKYICSFKGRYINGEKYKDYNLQKKYDILIYGTRYFINNLEKHQADKEYKKKWEKHYNSILPSMANFYPLRTRLENLLLKNKHKYRLRIIPSACIYNAPIVNENLSKLINQSWLTLSSSSRADIAMSKYFEIAGSYSGILGNIPSDYEELFKNNIVEVTEWMSDEEILSTIDKALEDKKGLWEMTKRLGDRIHREYDLKAAVTNIDDVLELCKAHNSEREKLSST